MANENDADAARQMPDAEPDNRRRDLDVAGLAASLARATSIGHIPMPKFDLAPLVPELKVTQVVPKLPVPSVVPQLDIARWMPEPSEWVKSQLAEAIRPIAEVFRAHASVLEPLFESLRSVAKSVLDRALPANLRAVPFTVDELEAVATEGITVYAVPSADVVRQLLAAPDARARREILGRRFTRIVADCDDLLDACVEPDTREAVIFARAGIAAARGGHTHAAQALWANTLDSLLWAAFEPTARKAFVDRNHRTTTDPRTLRELLLMAPIAHGHSRYFPAEGDLIPRTFSRHASAHGVSRRQYNKRNAAQALLLLTSLIAYLNDL